MKKLALHGFTGSKESWPATWPIERLSLKGHASDLLFEGGETFETEAQRLSELVQDSTHLIGYSCGARLCLAAALKNNPNIKRLSLISSHFGLKTESERQKRRDSDNTWASLLENEGINSFESKWSTLGLWDSQSKLPKQVLKEQERIRRAHDPLQLALSLKTVGLGEMPNCWPLLPKINVPVDLIVGADDTKFLTLAKQAASSLNDVNLVVIPKCGHNPLLESPTHLKDILWRD